MTPALIVPVLGGLDPSARAIINAFTTPPTGARKALINSTVKALKSGGVWNLLDSLYILAAADSQAARVDWKRPTVTATENSSPTFTTDRGYTFNGTTNYLDTAFTPSSQGVNMVSSVGTWAVWERTNLLSSTYHGAQGTSGAAHRVLLAPRRTGDVIGGGMASNIIDAGTGQTTSIGLTALSANGTTTMTTHKDGVNKGTGVAASSGGSCNRPLWLGGYNAGSLTTPRATQVAACFAGSLQTDALHLAAYNALAAYMTAVGA